MITVKCDFCDRECSPKNHFRISIHHASGALRIAGDMCRHCVDQSQLTREILVPQTKEHHGNQEATGSNKVGEEKDVQPNQQIAEQTEAVGTVEPIEQRRARRRRTGEPSAAPETGIK